MLEWVLKYSFTYLQLMELSSEMDLAKIIFIWTVVIKEWGADCGGFKQNPHVPHPVRAL